MRRGLLLTVARVDSPLLSPHLLFPPPPAWVPALVLAEPWALRPPRRALLTALLRCLLCSLEQRSCSPGTEASGSTHVGGRLHHHKGGGRAESPAGHRSRPERRPAQPPGPVAAVFLTSLIPSCKNMLSFTDLDEGLGVLSPSCANTGPTPSPFLCFTEL